MGDYVTFVFGVYDGGGCFFDYSKPGKVSLYFVSKPNRPKELKEGSEYRLMVVVKDKRPIYYVDEKIR